MSEKTMFDVDAELNTLASEVKEKFNNFTDYITGKLYRIQSKANEGKTKRDKSFITLETLVNKLNKLIPFTITVDMVKSSQKRGKAANSTNKKTKRQVNNYIVTCPCCSNDFEFTIGK